MTKSYTPNRIPQGALATKLVIDIVTSSRERNSFNWSIEEKDWIRLLKRASQNRVLYLFAHELIKLLEAKHQSSFIEKLFQINNQGEIRLRRLDDTLGFVSTELEKHEVPYLVIKTDKYIPYVTFDVDILVKEKDFEAVQRLFSTKGAKILPHHSLLGRKPGKQVNCLKPGLLNIDIHTEVTWQGSDYVEPNLFWKNTRCLARRGVTFEVPSLEVEFLVNCAEILFERFYFHLQHLLSLREFCHQAMDWELIFEQTSRYGWKGAFAELLLLLEGSSAQLLKSEPTLLAFEVKARALQVTGRKELPKAEVLPILFSLARVCTIFLERMRTRKHFDPICFSYWCYTRMRYLVTGGRRLPLYQDWIPLGDRFYWRKPY